MVKKENTNVLLVDDHQILLDGINDLLIDNGFNVIAKAQNTSDALNILEENEVDIMITDIQMPGEDGVELIKKVRKRFPDIRIVVLSMHEERGLVLDIVQLGIHAYLLKNITSQQLLRAMSKVKTDKFYISEEISHLLLEKVQDDSERRLLSKREHEVLKLIAREYSNKKIAKALFISERTVESHRKNIFRKTNTNSIVGLIKYAIAHKLI